MIGASMRRSSARPFAAPRTSSMVPSVTMNGTTWSLVISRPFSGTAQRGGRDGAGSRGAPGPIRRSSSATTTVLERDDRADGQIDPAGDDHHRHAERGDAHDDGLPRHQLEVRRR